MKLLYSILRVELIFIKIKNGANLNSVLYYYIIMPVIFKLLIEMFSLY